MAKNQSILFQIYIKRPTDFENDHYYLNRLRTSGIHSKFSKNLKRLSEKLSEEFDDESPTGSLSDEAYDELLHDLGLGKMLEKVLKIRP